ncbi:MAG: transferrin-binding protein-like solute binding protein, partial [Alphaproteobacteria bacterium]|nr:transferrin-binding protein-like solute binding protein [Alphaproteobacteria bacterium]
INANHLDFSGTLNYGYDATNMVALNDATGDVTGGSGLTGKADARFYGSVAQEFGGTFLLANANSYYYGGFGGQPNHVLNYNFDKNIVDSSATGPALNYQDDIDNPSDKTIPALAIDKKADNATYYESIDELFKDGPNLAIGDTKSLTLPAFGHHRYYQYSYQRNDNSIAWLDSNISHDVKIVRNLDSVVSLNFYVGMRGSDNRVFYQYGSDADGKKEGVTVYTGRFEDGNTAITAQYAGNTGSANRTFFRGESINIDPTYTSQVRTHRNDTGEYDNDELFGFMPKYLIGITWNKYLKNSFFNDDNIAEANGDTVYGRMIAGFETGRNFNGTMIGSIPTDASANATFTGKGGGFYGYKKPTINLYPYISKRETIVFNVAANVDFANKNIDFSIYNNCYYTTCTIKRKGLDFNATTSFTANDISTNVTTDNGLLAGTLDARFYGGAAQEIGGSFIMTGDDIYYYGTFATSSANFDGTDDSFSVSQLMHNDFTRHTFEDHYEFSEAVNIPYASFAKAASANESSRFVVRGSAVQQSDITDYVRQTKATSWNSAADVRKVRNISLARSETPAVALDFDADGKISAIEAYFGFNSYKSTVLADGATGVTANGAMNNTEYADAKTSNISANRSAFGFDANYMVYVNWNFVKTNRDSTNTLLADDIYKINGMMVAGIETQTMPNSGNDIAFNGRGKGNYGDKNADHAVTFRAYADVNFTNRTVEFATHDTACAVNACALDANTLSTLNFSKSLSYNMGENNIDSDLTIGDLSGKINTRFYGVGDDSGSEFAGTFSLNDNAHYYYGYFGIHEGGVIISAVANSIADVTIPEADRQPIAIPPNNAGGTPYPWLSLVIDDYKTVTVQGTAAYRTNNIVYTRATGQNDWTERDATDTLSVSKLTGAAARIKPNAYGNLSEITIYLDNDESYTISDKGHYSNTTFNKAFSKGDVSGHMSISRETSLFGFSPKNIYYIGWTLNKAILSDNDTVLEDNTYTKRGVLLVGSESKISQIPAKSYPAFDSLVKFSGKGRGYYNDASGVERRTKFNITANVDFHFKDVSLSTSYLYLCHTSCSYNTTLNFTTATPLSYGDANGNIISNNVSGAIKSRTYGEGSNVAAGNFTGTVDAKFYGVKASEFAGTFTLIDDEYNTHYGIFGTKAKFNSSTFSPVNPNLSQTTVVRTAAATGAVSPNASNTKTYEKYDSFFAAQQDAKNGVRYNNYPHHAVHTPALAAFREDTTRYQRVTADIGTAWDDDDIIAELSYAGNLYYASSSMRYRGADGRIYNAQVYGNNVTYGLNNTDNQLSGKPNFSSTTNNADKYHYFTGNNLQYTASPQLAKLYPSKVDTNLTVEKPDEFGFTAKYMAYIRWSVAEEKNDLWNDAGADSIYDIDGYMISGFETEHNTRGSDGKSSDDLPMTGQATFKGAGMGTYHAASRQSYRTNIGNVSATAKFADGTVDLTMSGTTCVVGLNSNACTDNAITSALPNLDVAEMTLTFAVGKNNMTAIAAETKGGMQGQIDARFYGQNRTGTGNQNAAKEFGGAFSFRDGDKSYIGIFGTSCEASGGVCP